MMIENARNISDIFAREVSKKFSKGMQELDFDMDLKKKQL